jgi:gamma-glutamylcyclotransferase (GGCT)/AIG2-like uncharacterized protein YtfP
MVIELAHCLAYGSNLHPVRMKARVLSAKVIGIVSMPGKRLAFHKKSNRDDSGKCNVRETHDPADILYTVLYEFDYAEKGRLDTLEGLGYGYNERQLTVECDGQSYEGVFIYEADPAHLHGTLTPNHEYKEMVLLGAKYHGFPAAYIAGIEAIVSTTNPYPTKQAQDEKVLVKMREFSAKEVRQGA